MTRQPEKYKNIEIPGKLVFTAESPLQLVKRFENAGEQKILIVGGAHIAASFLREQLIDELWLTIEPKIFGKGENLVSEEKLDINLRLVSCLRANDQGTLFTKYEVIRNR
jgi:dihydrofolate reductase